MRSLASPGPNGDRVKSAPSRAATLGSTAAAGVRIVVWCKACRHQVEPVAAEMAERYGADLPFSIGKNDSVGAPPTWC